MRIPAIALTLAMFSGLITGCERVDAFGSGAGTGDGGGGGGGSGGGVGLYQATSTGGFFKGTPVISADGSTVVFISMEDLVGNGNTSWQLFAVDSDGGNLKQVSPGGFEVFEFDVSSDGSLIVFANHGTGEIYRASRDGSSNLLPIFGSPRLTPDGGSVVHTYGGELMVSNLSGTIQTEVILDGLGLVGRVGVSENADAIVFSSKAVLQGANDDGNLETYLIRPTGSIVLNQAEVVRLTNGAGDSFRPSISADGQVIAFFDAGPGVVSIMSADGSKLVDIDGYLDPFAGISQSGTHVVFGSGGSVFVADLVSGQTIQITGEFGLASREYEPSISANGSRVAFVSGANFTGENGDGGPEIFVTK